MRIKFVSVFMSVMLLTIAFVFEIKHDTEQAAAKVADLRRQIDAENEKISWLNAQYSVLIQPERIEKLVNRYPEQLPYVQLPPEQIVSVNELPFKSVPVEKHDEWFLSGAAYSLEPVESSE